MAPAPDAVRSARTGPGASAIGRIADRRHPSADADRRGDPCTVVDHLTDPDRRAGPVGPAIVTFFSAAGRWNWATRPGAAVVLPAPSAPSTANSRAIFSTDGPLPPAASPTVPVLPEISPDRACDPVPGIVVAVNSNGVDKSVVDVGCHPRCRKKTSSPPHGDGRYPHSGPCLPVSCCAVASAAGSSRPGVRMLDTRPGFSTRPASSSPATHRSGPRSPSPGGCRSPRPDEASARGQQRHHGSAAAPALTSPPRGASSVAASWS
ncbi:hypothetical protein B0E54_00037 [Micromonospora sp. MH99]|nr:hypothetical protein [Micromonospora sp. MH99]